MRLARAALVVLALVLAAWFGLGAHQAIDTSRATSILSAGGSVTRGEAVRVSSLLDGAGALNPDRQVDLLRGQLALEQGQPRRAQRLISRVTRAEPQNLEAWLSLAQAATNNPPLFDHALVRVRRLEPLLPTR
jgi:predicted Zn-dependent protease